MRSKITPLAAIAFALMAAPAMAQTGHVGVGYTSNDEGETDGFVVEGAAAFGVSDSIGLQVDGGVGLLDSFGDDFTGYELNGHLFYTAGAARFGGLFGAAGGEYDGGGNDPATTHWGVEGQYTLNRVVLGASAIWGDAEWILSPDIEYENYDFHGDFYATENFVVGANYGIGTLDNGVSSEADTSTYGVSGEWQFSTMPISLVAGYQHWEIEQTGSVQSETLSLGVRWDWGGSLQARDAAGFRHSPNGLIGSYVGF